MKESIFGFLLLILSLILCSVINETYKLMYIETYLADYCKYKMCACRPKKQTNEDTDLCP